MTVIFEQIKSAVLGKIPSSKVFVQDITGEGKNFLVEVESLVFENQAMLEQHKLVMGSLENLLSKNKIHAVSVKTRIPAS